MNDNYTWGENTDSVTEIQKVVDKVRNEVQKVIIGQDDLIELIMVSVFAGGHVLLEGVPGVAKTLASKLMAKTLNVGFSRIQFTPDMMPSDVTGTSVYNMQTAAFTFNKGPVFSNMVLIDEINRAPAKTQASLFEVMEEKQVTVDGTTYLMAFPFMVIATQNPIEQEGTYKLPEAQLDRFLFRLQLGYPTLEQEQEILKRFRNDFSKRQVEQVQAVINEEDIKKCQEIVEKIHIKDELLNYIAAITLNTRNNADLFLGASPRASLSIMQASKAVAAINGRDFVTPDDIQYVAFPVLNHRIILTPEREMEGMDVRDVIKEIIAKVEVPR